MEALSGIRGSYWPRDSVLLPVEKLMPKQAIDSLQKSAQGKGDISKVTAWNETDLSTVSHLHQPIIASTTSGANNAHMPRALSVRIFTLGGAGSGGPSFRVVENFGATVAQVTTADGKELFATDAKEGSYSRKLTGAGAIGGMPIVAPAGRTLSDDSKAEMKHKGNVVVSFHEAELLGTEGRIPLDRNNVMSHGAIFTSQKWSPPKVESMGKNGKDGIRVTYTLDFTQDVVLSKMGPGKMKVVYTLVQGKNGETIFDSDIKVTSKDEIKPVYIGALAQHSFFNIGENDTLQTSAPDEVKSRELRPELATGEIDSVAEKNSFKTARPIHKNTAGEVEVVLTGYEKTPDRRPKAVITRPDDNLKIEVEAGGITGDVPGFDGFLVCNKGRGTLMLEPIARYPNIMNVYDNSNRPDIRPIVVTALEPFRAHSRITATTTQQA